MFYVIFKFSNIAPFEKQINVVYEYIPVCSRKLQTTQQTYYYKCYCSIVVITADCGSANPGSIPGNGIFFIIFLNSKFTSNVSRSLWIPYLSVISSDLQIHTERIKLSFLLFSYFYTNYCNCQAQSNSKNHKKRFIEQVPTSIHWTSSFFIHNQSPVSITFLIVEEQILFNNVQEGSLQQQLLLFQKEKNNFNTNNSCIFFKTTKLLFTKFRFLSLSLYKYFLIKLKMNILQKGESNIGVTLPNHLPITLHRSQITRVQCFKVPPSSVTSFNKRDIKVRKQSQQYAKKIDPLTQRNGDSNIGVEGVNISFSEFQRNSRIVITENISNFIDSQSTEISDRSFCSELLQKQSANLSKNSIQKSQSLDQTSGYSFKYISELESHSIKIFEQGNRSVFKPEFTIIIQKAISEITTNSSKQNLKYQILFTGFKDLNIDHPFHQDFNTSHNLSNLLDKWFLNYQQYYQMILSFDFLFTHTSFISLVIFYWIKFQDQNQNPLISLEQQLLIRSNKNLLRQNILKCLYHYIQFRSRQIINNIFIQHLLNEFCKYLNNTFLKSNNNPEIQCLCNQYIQELQDCLKRESYIKSKINIGQNVATVHLQFIYDKYQTKDKFIQQSLEEQTALFLEIDQRNFINSPLSRYYQTGQQSETNRILAKHYNLMTCWMLNLVLKKCKIDAWKAVVYCIRFFLLCKAIFFHKNYQRTVFFINILRNIKANIPNLWRKFIQRMKTYQNIDVQQQIDEMFSVTQKLTLVSPKVTTGQELARKQSLDKKDEVIIFPEIKIHKIALTIKQNHKSYGIINLDLHKNIQEFAQKIIRYRQIAENHLIYTKVDEVPINKTIKMNLNFRFLNSYIFEILSREEISETQRFERWKLEAKEVNLNIYFPGWFWNLFQ